MSWAEPVRSSSGFVRPAARSRAWCCNGLPQHTSRRTGPLRPACVLRRPLPLGELGAVAGDDEEGVVDADSEAEHHREDGG